MVLRCRDARYTARGPRGRPRSAARREQPGSGPSAATRRSRVRPIWSAPRPGRGLGRGVAHLPADGLRCVRQRRWVRYPPTRSRLLQWSAWVPAATCRRPRDPAAWPAAARCSRGRGRGADAARACGVGLRRWSPTQSRSPGDHGSPRIAGGSLAASVLAMAIAVRSLTAWPRSALYRQARLTPEASPELADRPSARHDRGAESHAVELSGRRVPEPRWQRRVALCVLVCHAMPRDPDACRRARKVH